MSELPELPILVTFARAIAALPHPAPAGGDAGDRKVYTMCAYCKSVEGGHTLACQSIHGGNPPGQVPIPEDAPWLIRRRAEDTALTAKPGAEVES